MKKGALSIVLILTLIVAIFLFTGCNENVNSNSINENLSENIQVIEEETKAAPLLEEIQKTNQNGEGNVPRPESNQLANTVYREEILPMKEGNTEINIQYSKEQQRDYYMPPKNNKAIQVPPEAIDAWNDLKEGETCNFENPDGEIVGECELVEEALSCKPSSDNIHPRNPILG